LYPPLHRPLETHYDLVVVGTSVGQLLEMKPNNEWFQRYIIMILTKIKLLVIYYSINFKNLGSNYGIQPLFFFKSKNW
jgi:hypothetical protein